MTSNTASKILGVHPSTVKRQCQRGRLRPERTRGGHLRIHASQLADYLRSDHQEHVLHSVGDELTEYLDALRSHFEQNCDDQLTKVLFEALLEGKDHDFHAMVEHLFLVYPEDVMVLGPILLRQLREIEIRYKKGLLSIADEHRITQTIRDTIIRHHFRMLKSFSPNGRQVVIGCAAGDHHDITALLTRSVFSARGFTVRYLGADVPNEEYRREQERWNACIVCICRTLPSGPGEDRNLLRSLISSLDRDRTFEVFLGGQWSEWANCIADRTDGLQLIDTLKKLDNLLSASA